MRRLGEREGVELERHARVAGAHDAVSDETLVVARVAEMAAQAYLRPLRRVLGSAQPGIEVRLMAGPRQVHSEPTRARGTRWPGTAVAGLAADPVGEAEQWPAPVGRHVVGMTIEAERRRRRIGEAEIAGDPPGPL